MHNHSDSRLSSLIEFVHVTKKISGRKVIDNLSFNLSTGEVLGIIGPSGAGKSTLLKMVAGFVQPCVGYGRIFGFDLQDQVLQARRMIGYLPQGLVGFDDMAVINFLKFIAHIRGLRGAQRSIRIDELVGRFQLEHLLHLPLGALKYSENRLVGLAQAVVHEPPALILDDPCEGLDPKQQAMVRSFIEVYSVNRILILATRLLDDVTTMCSRALIIENGLLRVDGTLEELQALSSHHHAITLSTVQPIDLLALAVLPGVAGIEVNSNKSGAVTILAKPGAEIFPNVLGLIIERNWKVSLLSMENGRLYDVFHKLTK